MNEKGEKMKEQLGVVRTNCIDCLDRTNVTQVSKHQSKDIFLSSNLYYFYVFFSPFFDS